MRSVISQRIKHLRRQRAALNQLLVALEEIEEVSFDLFDDIFMKSEEDEDPWITVERTRSSWEAITQELEGLEYLLVADYAYLDRTPSLPSEAESWIYSSFE